MASSKESDETDENEFFWTLENIPKELLLHICSFLSTKFIVEVLSEVCTRFKCLIEDDATWRIRLFSRWPRKYPIIKSDNFSWKAACIEREEQHRLWRDNASQMKMYHIKGAHIASVDVVEVIENGRLCASGSRDHSIKIWNLYNLNEHSPEDGDFSETCTFQKDAAHVGWIWCMVYSECNQRLYSGSWENLIKTWDINDFTTEIQTFRLSSPVLCLAFSGNVLVSGTYNKVIKLFDPRTGTKAFHHYLTHEKPVLCAAADERFIISGSEDHTVAIYDRTAGKVRSVIKLGGYSMSMSYKHKHLWVGDNQGFLHVIDPSEENFELLKSYRSGHRSQVTGVQYSLGSIITSSLDKTLQVLEPNDDPKPIARFEFKAGVAGISTCGDILASANSDDSIAVWMPKSDE